MILNRFVGDDELDEEEAVLVTCAEVIVIPGATINLTEDVDTDVNPTKKLRARKSKPDFTEFMQIQMLNDNQDRAHQRKVAPDALVNQVEDHKQATKMIAAAATGYFKFNKKKRKKMRTKIGGGIGQGS